jgi:diguanylate cyclase (GGDEF)-like protein
MEEKLVSNKALIFRIIVIVLFISLFILIVSTEYIKKTAVDTLAGDDAKKTAQLVFETMNARMQEGWTKQDLEKIVKRLQFIRKGMKVLSYRSPLVEQMFGIVQKDKQIVQADPLIQKAMRGEEVFTIDEKTNLVRFLYPMKVTENCIICHSNAQMGSVNGVLDIEFPQSDIKISLDTMTTYFIIFFVLFLLVLFYIFFLLINKKMVKPIVELTNEIENIEQSKELTRRATIHTNIQELRVLQNSFNSLLKTIKYYYDKTIQKIYTDSLTGLNNLSKLEADLVELKRASTLIILDIKGFGKINRVYGTNIADILLKQFAINLSDTIGKMGTIYRLYGDEFAIIYSKYIEDKELKKIFKTLKAEEFTYNDSSFNIEVTIGYAYSTTNNEHLLENANIALAYAKKCYKNIAKFDDALAIKDEDLNHMVWLDKLDIAIQEDKIVPVFMPMKNTKTGKIDKYETLVRIQDKDKLHTPDKFLDVAHASGKYPIITQTVIKKAFNYFKDIDGIKFSINFALSDIQNKETMDLLFKSLKDYKNSQNVVIELLETEELSDFELLNRFITKVKSYGATVAIDDFGSGYSNFNYILNLDVDIIKLDSSLVENIFTDQYAAVVVSNIVRVAKELNLLVVAEKVKSQEIENILTIHEVDYLQGFHIGKPDLEILKV